MNFSKRMRLHLKNLFGLVMLTAAVVLQAQDQSYQSAFSEVKYDRAKGPATFTAGVEVEASTGAVNMDIPFGPGIGERGLRFRPRFSMRMAPQLAISSKKIYANGPLDLEDGLPAPGTLDTLYQRTYGTATFSPGTFDLALMGFQQGDAHQSSYSLPDGGGGYDFGQPPAGMTTSAAQSLLARFGLSSYSIGYKPGDTTRSPKVPFIQTGSTGSLILGLRTSGSEGLITDEVQDWVQEDPSKSGGAKWDFPRRILVVQGDVAYLYTYVSHSYAKYTVPYIATGDKVPLMSAHYLLTQILNRFGEQISITYNADGIGYTVTWNTNSNVKITVQDAGCTSIEATPDLRGGSITNVQQIRVSYQGITPAVSSTLFQYKSFIVDRAGDPPGVGAALASSGQRMLNGYWGGISSLQPIKVVQESTGEFIEFNYGIGPSTTWINQNLPVTPVVLASVVFPNRSVAFDWEVYRYRNIYSPYRRPDYAYGVKRIQDQDLPSGEIRETTHTRVVPVMNWLTNYPIPGDNTPETWVSTTFYDLIHYPGGQTTLHRFVEPKAGAVLATVNLAESKHLERETRYYDGGYTESDLSITTPGSSTAYKWVVKDRFCFRFVGGEGAIPYPTRTRTWDKDSQAFSAEEKTDWSTSSFGWCKSHRSAGVSGSPDLSFELSSLADTGKAYAQPSLSKSVERTTVHTLDTDLAEWLIARDAGGTTTTQSDSTDFKGSGVSLPKDQPPVSKTFDSQFNTLKSVTVGTTGLGVTTTFQHQGVSGLAAYELLDVTVTGTSGLAQSGKVGVSAYGYDANGFLSSISQRPDDSTTTLTVQQQADEIGRPTSQTDANGNVQKFDWDAAGRLTGITPQWGDLPTSISYNDSDHLGATITRGNQVTELRYNGFGELVLERRKDGNGTWSHRIFGYDKGGRKTAETVWISGRGEEHETSWKEANLTRTITRIIDHPSETVCRAWSKDPENPTCLEWITKPGYSETITYPAIAAGTLIQYDSRGRVSDSWDMAGIQTHVDYPAAQGIMKSVTEGVGTTEARTTSFLSDALGRLGQVTDALSQVTTYRYDHADRISEVIQKDASGHVQTRTWTYNDLGWLKTLVQPESGTISYDQFTVLGKPQSTNYNGRIVSSVLDYLQRPKSITADDGSVAQTYTYDTASGGLGKLATSSSQNSFGSVVLDYDYSASGGQLKQLKTTVGSQVYTQVYEYDAYGQRTSASVDGRVVQTIMDTARGMPQESRYKGSSVVTATYDSVSWNLSQLTYTNGGTTSFFQYEDNQARLHSLTHAFKKTDGTLDTRAWTYQYDGVGRIAADGEDSYTYDVLDRLKTATVQWWQDPQGRTGPQTLVQTFTYDSFGNMLSAVATGAPTWLKMRFSHAASDTNLLTYNRLPQNTTTGAAYDAQGNLTQVNTTPGDLSTGVTLTYDALGRVTTLFDTKRNVTERYQYTAEGLRTIVEEWAGNTLNKRRYCLYNDARQLVSQYEETLSGGVVPASAMKLASASVSAKTLKLASLTVPVKPCGATITSPSGTITAYVGSPVLFTGTTYYGDQCTWTFGDGTTSVTSGATSSVNHTYAATGTFKVTLTTVSLERANAFSPSTATVTINVVQPLPAATLSASATTIAVGGSITLSWSTTNATSATLNGNTVTLNGSKAYAPATTTTYTLAVVGLGGSTSKQVTVVVVQKPVISSFSASPSSITQGDPSKLTWAVTGATSLSLDNGIGAVTGTSRSVSPSTTTTYTLTATNTINGVSAIATKSVTVTVVPQPATPIITSFTADATTIGVGTGTTLRWVTSNAATVTLNGTSVAATGSQVTGYLATTISYSLVASNTNALGIKKSVSKDLTITVIQKPVITFAASLTTISLGSSSTLSWSITNSPTSVSIDSGVGAVSAAGNKSVSPSATSTYTITASNLGGTVTKSVTVNVTPKPVVVSFIATPATITDGRSSTLSWVAQGASSYTINGMAVTGTSVIVAPNATKSYTLRATNASGYVEQTLTVTVKASGTLVWKRDIVYLGGKEVAEFDANGMHVTQVDHLGSPRILTNANGVVESEQKFTPFGESLTGDNGKFAKGFTNHEQTDSSGLIYMQARFYVPGYGRFASPDPARDQHFEETQSWNIYSYVRNNPIASIDPTGLMAEDELKDNKGCQQNPNGARDMSGVGVYSLNNHTEEVVEKDKKRASQTERQRNPENNVAGFTSVSNAVKALVGEIASTYKDSKVREYGALIYLSDGKIHYGQIQCGLTAAESKDGRASVDLMSPEAVKGIPKAATLLGDVHTHPRGSAGGISGNDLVGIWGMKLRASTGDGWRGYKVDSQYSGYVWRNGDRSILKYSYPGPIAKIYDPENVAYSWIRR